MLALLACVAAGALTACDARVESPLGIMATTPTGDASGQLSLLPGSVDLRVGGSAQLVTSGASALLPVTYSTDAPAVATVTAGGLVTGVAPGVAIITATSTRDPARRTTAVVRVLAP
ncbi:MAG TPA: Ig-like domain-containing protein [Gemmatimonadaceae bacterium]|nr:Ig-like domain-containing protein [Gemmatimonadaceae bacterium]